MSVLTLTKLIAMKELEFKNGRISLLGRSAIFLPAEMMLRLHELIEAESGAEAADRIMVELGREQTVRGSEKYIARKKEFARMLEGVPKTGDAAFEMGREMMKFIGVGEIGIREISKDLHHAILTTSSSPYAYEYLKTRGRSPRPVCHHLKGLLIGVVEGTGNGQYDAKEIACMATGTSGECIFEFRKKP